MSDLQPFDFFRQEISHADAVVRTTAMTKATIISALIGAEKTRNDLLPLLRTKVEDLDQVLIALAQKLGGFVPYIGGPEYAHTLIPVLEPLCEIEEPTVREAAAASVSAILLTLSPSHGTSVGQFYEMFLRLSNEEGGEIFYGRVSCAQFLPELYRVVPAQDRTTLRETYNKFIADEMSMVRRGAAINFLRLVENCEPELAGSEFMQVMRAAATDEHPSVKIMAVENLAGYAKLLKKNNAPASIMSELVPVVKASVDDPSWRVRLVMAKIMGAFATPFAAADVQSEIFPSVICLIQDPEPEVRTSALQSIAAFVSVVGGPQFLLEFIPIVVQLVEDPIANVRKTMTDVVIDVCALVGPELVAQHISDIILRLIADEDPLVRLRVLKKLDIVAAASPTVCTRMADQLKTMFKDNNWRVRKQLGLVMPAVTRHLGADFFAERFMADYLTLLKDGVDEVREGCSSALAGMVASSNANWVHEKLFPSVRAMATDEYLIRVSMLTVLQGLIMLDLPERFQTETLALIIGATNDKVPNIRLKAAKVLGLACGFIGPENSRTRVRPVLAELLNDKDRDVKYFAAESIKSCA